MVFVPVRFVDADFESLLGFRRFCEALEDDRRRVSFWFNFGRFHGAYGRDFALSVSAFEFRFSDYQAARGGRFRFDFIRFDLGRHFLCCRTGIGFVFVFEV